MTVNDVFEFEDAAAELRLLVLASARPHVAAVAVGNNHWHCSCPIVAYDTYIRGGQEVANLSMTLNDPNLVFKVTPFFGIKYLTNGYRYGHSYYRRRIENRIQAFEWHQLQ